MKERTKKERKKEKGLSDGKVSTESVRNTLEYTYTDIDFSRWAFFRLL